MVHLIQRYRLFLQGHDCIHTENDAFFHCLCNVTCVFTSNFENNLKWNAHIQNVIKKGASRPHQLRQLKHAKADPAQLVCFYITCMHPLKEYGCQCHTFLMN